MSHKLVSLYIGDGEYYTRTDADAVIAELKARIADGDRDFDWAEHQNEMLLQIVRHHKYKRCLAMARWCHNQREIYERDSYDWELDDEAVASLRNKANIMRKWRKRWLEIAEKFKEEAK